MNYLRSQFNFKKKLFKDRAADGSLLTESAEENTPVNNVQGTAEMESVPNCCSCVIQ